MDDGFLRWFTFGIVFLVTIILAVIAFVLVRDRLHEARHRRSRGDSSRL